MDNHDYTRNIAVVYDVKKGTDEYFVEVPVKNQRGNIFNHVLICSGDYKGFWTWDAQLKYRLPIYQTLGRGKIEAYRIPISLFQMKRSINKMKDENIKRMYNDFMNVREQIIEDYE